MPLYTCTLTSAVVTIQVAVAIWVSPSQNLNSQSVSITSRVPPGLEWCADPDKLLYSVEWLAKEILMELLWEVTECGTMLELARDWEKLEWTAHIPKRSKQEENRLFKIL